MHHSLSARLRHDALSVRATRCATASQSALARRRHRLHGCAQDRQGDPRRLRLGRAHGQHRRGAVAGARARRWSSVSGYLIGSQEAGKMPLPPKAELQWWYQFYFATERGRAGYEKYRHDFAQADLADRLAASGTSTTPPSIAAPPPSTIRTTSPSSSTITAGGSAWPRASRSTTIWRSGLPQVPVITVPTITHGRRRQRRAASGAQRLRQEILRQVRAPAHHGRHRAQPAAGSAAGLCRGRHRRRRHLSGGTAGARLRSECQLNEDRT